MLKSKKIFTHILLGIFFITALSSCIKRSRPQLAPKNLDNYIIEFTITSNPLPECVPYLNKPLLFIFYPDGTYTSKGDGKPYQLGSYSCDRIGPNTLRVAYSYSSGDKLFTEIDEMYFLDHSHGTWKNLYHTVEDKTFEAGTFIIKSTSHNVKK